LLGHNYLQRKAQSIKHFWIAAAKYSHFAFGNEGGANCTKD